MPRKLKTFITNLGFFELAIAAPSMKAALEAWGMGANAFKQGFARETDDAKIVAATMAMPGTVLKRPVGTKGVFTQNAELPTLSNVLSEGSARPSKLPKDAAKSIPKKITRSEDETNRAAVISFEKAKARREQKQAAEEERREAQREKDQARAEKAAAKAQAALDAAREHHEAALRNIEKERNRLDRRENVEKERWEKERGRLEEALERAVQ